MPATAALSLLLGCSSASTTPDGKVDDAPHGDAGTAGNDAGHAAPYPEPSPDACLTSVVPGKQQLECEGLKFDLYVPEACLEKACGLIFDVHGFGMNGSLQGSHSKLPELGNAQGYIVANPSAPGNLLSAAWSAANDDQVLALMNHVIDVWHVDRKRIHFDGYSMGGWMTWRFVCKHADLIASAAPLAAGSQGNGGSCAFGGGEMPSREVPIFYTHGTTDGLVSFSTAVTERDALIAAWHMQEREVVASGPDYSWKRYENPNGIVFEFAEHNWETQFKLGGLALKGHCFPGSDQFLGCGADAKFNWGESVLKFFIDHPMP